MADAPIGISFIPTADAAANGPRQAGIEGQGGSDLAQAFKILSLHLPRVLGAAAIAPKRLLNSPGSAGVASAGGFNPYSAVFQSLLQQLTGGAGMGGPGADVASLSSLFGGGGQTSYGGDSGGSGGTGDYTPSSTPAPNVMPGDSGPKSGEGAPLPMPTPTPTPSYPGGGTREPRDPTTRRL